MKSIASPTFWIFSAASSGILMSNSSSSSMTSSTVSSESAPKSLTKWVSLRDFVLFDPELLSHDFDYAFFNGCHVHQPPMIWTR